MARKVKLDLHTHPVEALKDSMGIQGIRNIDVKVAEAIVKAVKNAGINGIAITEHNNFNHSWVAGLEIFDHFRKDNLIILPGEEIDCGNQQYLRIYVPEYYRRRLPFFQGKEWFYILAHPGFYNPPDWEQINSMKFDAVEERSLHGEFPAAGSIAHDQNIPLVQSSDAHKLEDLGKFYTEIDFT